jgi:uncharacterized protein with HEPN domain
MPAILRVMHNVTQEVSGLRGWLKRPKYCNAALYNLVIVGETLHRVSAAVKGAAPTMEWRGYSDLRNYIVYSYCQIDLEVIADVIQNRLGSLIAELDTLIAFVERAEI